MRRRRRTWHPTTGAIVLLVIIVAIGAGILFGRTIIGLLGLGKPPVVDAGNNGTGNQGTGQTNTGGQSGTGSPSGTGGQSGAGGTPAIVEVPFKIPALVTFNVQAGRFDNRDNASKLVTALTKAGYPAWSTQSPPYRVFVGSFADKKNANTLAAKLKAERPTDCGAAWTTSIAAPAIDKTMVGTDQTALASINTALQTVSEFATKEAMLWDARANDKLAAADLTALADAYSARLSKSSTDVKAATAVDSALRDKTLKAVVAAQNNLAKLKSLASGGTQAQYVEAAASLIEVSELYADAVAALTPVGN
ncbi:MAG: SPOR domain-containing protein [Chloroflexota bacterium]